MNRIDKVRAQIERAFNPALIDVSSRISEVSPSGNYSFVADFYGVDASHGNWIIAVVTVRDLRTGEVVAKIKRNDDSFYHCWIDHNGTEYLVCAEDLEGQTVIDLAQHKFASYSSEEDTFIWVQFHPSPSNCLLAVSGCNWACPWEIAVYDFSEPMHLPLKRIDAKSIAGEFVEWLSDCAFRIKAEDGIKQIDVDDTSRAELA